MKKSEVPGQCQVIIYKGADMSRCTRSAEVLYGKVNMCKLHHAAMLDRKEAERLRLKDKYEEGKREPSGEER